MSGRQNKKVGQYVRRKMRKVDVHVLKVLEEKTNDMIGAFSKSLRARRPRIIPQSLWRRIVLIVVGLDIYHAAPEK